MAQMPKAADLYGDVTPREAAELQETYLGELNKSFANASHTTQHFQHSEQFQQTSQKKLHLLVHFQHRSRRLTWKHLQSCLHHAQHLCVTKLFVKRVSVLHTA